MIIGLLMALAIGVSALPWSPPKIQCITPKSDGNFKITWSCNDCLYFTEYHIYVNSTLQRIITPSPSLSLCDYVDFDATIPNANSYECYMIAYDIYNDPYYSDTIRSIDLTVYPYNPPTHADLTWQPPTSSLDNSWGASFDIYKKRYFETMFQPVASVPITTGSSSYTYTDTSDVCNGSISYQIGITHSYTSNSNTYSCPFMSAIITVDNMMDDTRPETPVFDSVTVTANNQVMLGFHETEPYMMSFSIDTSSDQVAFYPKTDVTNGQTSWIDVNINPTSNFKYYRIRALDSCNNYSPMTESLWNMKLSLRSIDTCMGSATVKWGKNDRPIRDIDHYEVNLSGDGGVTWRTIGTTTNNTDTFKINNLNYNQNYIVFVRAANSDRTLTASSNRIGFKIPKPDLADFSYIQSVSVIDNQYIHIKALTKENPAFESITLQKSEDGINFKDFKTQSYLPNMETYEFDDNQANFELKTYYYRTFLTNSCKTSSRYSNISHNIVLRGEDLDRANRLSWQGYDNWDGGVADYFVKRKTENEPVFRSIADLPPSISNQYLDNISDLYTSGAKFTYYIEAKENYNQYGFSEASYSNFVTVIQRPTLYIPNAFRPNGSSNKVFRPVNSFVSFEQYRFSVFTRTGERIFSTTDPQEGWDGRIKGVIAPVNVYVYLIEYMLPDGSITEQTGTVTLIK